MLNASKRFLNGAFRRVPLGVCDMAIIYHPIIQILPCIDAIAAVPHKLDEMAHLDFVTLPAAVLQVAIQQWRPKRR